MSLIDGGNAFSTYDEISVTPARIGTIAEIAGLTFHGTENPSGLHFRRIVDWDGLPELKGRPESRPQGHGSFGAGEDFREALVLSLEGWYRGRTKIDALQMRRRLIGALAGEDLPLTVTDELGPGTRVVSVRRVDPGDLYGFRFDFVVDMLAIDPRMYGHPVTTSTGVPVPAGGLAWPLTWPITWIGGGSEGRVTLVNPGTADTFTVLEVTGQLGSGFVLTEVGTGREIRFERFVPAGSTVSIDTRTGATTIDGLDNDVSGYLTRSDWWPIKANSQSTIQFVPLGSVAGTPTLTARTAPAYW